MINDKDKEIFVWSKLVTIRQIKLFSFEEWNILYCGKIIFVVMLALLEISFCKI